MQTLLPWLIPPLLGAFIGYITNAIAIRMLFRPLQPWRIAGLRLPLTPGVIPSQRGELARRMGRMVGSHLMTAEDVGAALARPAFRTELKGAVEEKLGRLLDRDLGPVATLVPGEFRERFRELAEHLRRKLLDGVSAYLASPACAQTLREYLVRESEVWLARDLESFLTPEREAAWQGHLRQRLEQLLASEEVARGVGEFVERRFEEMLASGRTLREILPADLVETLLAQLEAEIPGLLERFGGLLYDPLFRERLARRGKEGIESLLDSLSGLSGLLAGFINLDKIYARMPEFFDRAADEVARWLREERTRREVAGFLRERVEGLLDRSLASWVETLPYDKVAGIRRYLREQLVTAVRSPRAARAAQTLVDGALQRIKDRSFRALLDQALPEGGVERLREAVIERVLRLLQAPEVRGVCDRFLAERLEEWLFGRPLGRLSARLPADLRDEISAGTTRLLEELLRKEIPPLIESLDVQRIVEEKVNALDLLEVEGLLLGIMREQFKYINLFGALLGLLLGLVNLVLLALM